LRLPLVPDWKASGWLEYSWALAKGQYNAFVRTQWSYNGNTVNILEEVSPLTSPNPQFTNPSYVQGDLRFGVSSDSWEVSLFLNNLTDERCNYTTYSGQFEWGMASVADGRSRLQRVYTCRPREMGLRFTKTWGG